MMIRLSITLLTLHSLLSPTIQAKLYKPPTTGGQSPFLKEILTGRCYHHPPSGNPLDSQSCPSTIGTLMSILESHLDDDISPTSFDQFLKKSSLVPPPDAALFYLSSSVKNKVTIPNNLVTPEDTPGGALLKDLTICGVDKRQNCDGSKSHATLAFWRGVYGAFAAEARGRVQLVLPDDDDGMDEFFKTLFTLEILPNINTSSDDDVSEVIIYAKDCTGGEMTSGVMAELKDTAKVKNVSCQEDNMVRFLICQDPNSEDCRKCNVLGGVGGVVGERMHILPRPHGVRPPPPHDDVPPQHGPGEHDVVPPPPPPHGPDEHDAVLPPPPHGPGPVEPPHPPEDEDDTQKMNTIESPTETKKKGHFFLTIIWTILIGCIIIYGLLAIKRYYYYSSGYQPIDPRPAMGPRLPPSQ